MKKIGLVGGMSWVSTLDYYRLLNEGINEKRGGLNFAECLLYSVNFGDIQAKTWENSFDILHHACQSLKAGGAEAIVLCANTAHLFAEKLQQETGLPLIHLVSATAHAIREHGLSNVGLLGTKMTMELDFYRNGLAAQGIASLIPEAQANRDFIQHTLKEELGRGILKPETKKAYLAIIQDLLAAGAEGIVLGCTEIPMLIQQSDVAVPIFDTTKIHAQAAVAFALSD